MRDIQKILFPVDLSPSSPKIVPYAKLAAQKFNTDIVLLFVARRIDHFSAIQVSMSTIEEFHQSLLIGGKNELETFKETYFKDMIGRVEADVQMGDIAEEIIKYIKPNQIDMIVMGTHGRKGIEKLFFGSVAEKVVKTATVPVFLVNPFKVSGPEDV